MAVYVNPTNGQATPISSTSDVVGLVNTLTRFIYSGAEVKNRYSVFDKTPLEFGAIIESVRTPATASIAVNPNQTMHNTPNYPNYAKRYISAPVKRQYHVNISNERLERVVDGRDNLNNLVAVTINANNEGEKLEANKNYIRLFASNNIADGEDTVIGTDLDDSDDRKVFGFLTKTVSDQYEVFETATFKDIMEWIKATSKDMTFENSIYSNGYECGCDMSDLVLIMPHKLVSSMDVRYWADVRNLEKVGDIPTIIEADLPDSVIDYDVDHAINGYYIIIADRRALGRVVMNRHAKMYDVENDTVDHVTYVTDEFYFDPNYKCMALITNKPTA